MRDIIYLLFLLLTTVAKLLRPNGGRMVIAENLLLKQQLIIHNRSRQRAPNLSTQDRALLGFWSLFVYPRRIVRAAIFIKPSTLLSFHNALKKRKYKLLYSPGGGRKPGPKGPSREVINAILFMRVMLMVPLCAECSTMLPHGQDWPKNFSSDNDPLFHLPIAA